MITILDPFYMTIVNLNIVYVQYCIVDRIKIIYIYIYVRQKY
jgi:hypothetical protein